MIVSTLARVAVIMAVVGLSAGCANTIRGVGADAANTVDATQQAGRTVVRAAN